MKQEQGVSKGQRMGRDLLYSFHITYELHAALSQLVVDGYAQNNSSNQTN